MSNESDKNVVLSDEERKVLLDHDYDGIEEFDFPLPSWWVWTFIGGIVFAIFYFIFYSVMGAPGLRASFNKDWEVVTQIRQEQAKQGIAFDMNEYNQWLAANNGGKEKALEVFEENCLSCHEEGGKGDIGPNLTDDYWIHLKTINPETIYKFVYKGYEDNGMPAWGETLSKEELFAAATYVNSIKFTNVPGKEPQGDKVEK